MASANVHASAACIIAAHAMMQAETHSQMLFPDVRTLLQASAAVHGPKLRCACPLTLRYPLPRQLPIVFSTLRSRSTCLRLARRDWAAVQRARWTWALAQAL